MAKSIWSLMLMLLLSSCVNVAEPTPTPFTFQRIAVAPELEGLVSSWLSAYIEETGQANLKLEPIARQEIMPSLETGFAGLGVVSQEVRSGWFATPLWREAIAVITHPGVKPQPLTLEVLAGVFAGRVDSWEILAESNDSIQVVVPAPGSMFRERFVELVMKDAPFDPEAIVGGTPEAIFEFVKLHPGGIGFLPFWRVEDGVEIAAISGAHPQYESLLSGTYPLWLDVVAISPQEPAGSLRNFLVWLQGTHLPNQSVR